MLRCIAIDDEPLALELLEDNIGKVPYLELVALCSQSARSHGCIAAAKRGSYFSRYTNAGFNGLAVYTKPYAKTYVHTYYCVR